MRTIWLAALFAAVVFSGAYASEIATEVAVPEVAVVVNEASIGSVQMDNRIDAELEALLDENVVSSSSQAAPSTGSAGSPQGGSGQVAPLSDYFAIETPELQKAGQTKLAQWQDELYDRVQELDSMVRKMADDGVVTSAEFFDLEQALRAYGNLLSAANQELAFYRLSLPEDERVKTYWRLHNIEQRHFLGDDRKKSVRRFFFNLTGKDVRVKVNAEDLIGRAFIMPLALPFTLVLEATGQ
jgi:hypothetical protein